MSDDHQPIRDSNPPIASIAVVVGVVVAIIGVVTYDRPARIAAKRAEVQAPPPPPATTVFVPASGLPPGPLPGEDLDPPPVPAPWPSPGDANTSTTTSGAIVGTVTTGVSAMGRDAAVAYFTTKMDGCALQHFVWRAKATSLLCENATTEGSALVVAGRTGKSHLLTVNATYKSAPTRPPSPDPMGCGSSVHFVSLPKGAVVTGAGGGSDDDPLEGEEDGDCSFSVNGPAPPVAWDVANRIFRRDAETRRRSLGGPPERDVIEGFQDGVYWRVDAVSSSAGGSDVRIFRWSTGHGGWKLPPEERRARVEALVACKRAPCAEPLVLAGRHLGDDNSLEPLWNAKVDRCLYACAGEPDAPASVEPLDTTPFGVAASEGAESGSSSTAKR